MSRPIDKSDLFLAKIDHSLLSAVVSFEKLSEVMIGPVYSSNSIKGLAQMTNSQGSPAVRFIGAR